MSEQTSEALRTWFKRVEPLYPELFNAAHAICGNYDQAEYALRSTILEVWAQSAESGLGFREKLRGTLRDEAMSLLEESEDKLPELTWTGFVDDGEDPLIRQACRERPETQRVLMLRHGVGLSVGKISRITGDTPTQVRTTLERFESRCRRVLSAQERSRFDALFSRAARRQLASRVGVPQPGTVYRAFEAEASLLTVREHRFGKVFYHVVVFLMAIICAALFWLLAVLVQIPEGGEQLTPTPAPEATAESFSETSFETVYETEAPA